MNSDGPQQSEHLVAPKLTWRYIVALAAVAVLSILGQVLIQLMLARHDEDSRVINVAGRQSMLSQRICKAALALLRVRNPDNLEYYRSELATVTAHWQRAHEGLQRGDAGLGLSGTNSEAARVIYRRIQPSFDTMLGAALSLTRARDRDSGPVEIDAAVSRLLLEEPALLDGMEAIVNLYQSESEARVAELRRIEFALLVLVLIMLLFEGLFVFRPAARRIRDALRDLREAMRKLRDSEAEKSAVLRTVPDELLMVNEAGEIRAVYSNARRDGILPDEDLIGRELAAVVPPRAAWLFSNRVGTTLADGGAIEFEYPLSLEDGVRYVEARAVRYSDDASLVLLRDLTERRRLEQEVLDIGERVQKRIGQDIHDDLCQHLAGLRLIAGSIAVRTERGESVAAEEVSGVAALAEQALKIASGVARGLYPAVLEQRGLAAAMAELADAAQLRSGISFTCRLDEPPDEISREVALQLYRIVQESVGNAVRHSAASNIALSLETHADRLELKVEDDGNGIPGEASRAGGMGLRIMANRARMIGAEVRVEPVTPHGTCVTCELPVPTGSQKYVVDARAVAGEGAPAEQAPGANASTKASS